MDRIWSKTLWTAHVLAGNTGHPGCHVGDGFAHLAVGMPDVHTAYEEMRKPWSRSPASRGR